MLCYKKSNSNIEFNKVFIDVEKKIKNINPKINIFERRGKYYLRDLDYKGSYSESMDYPILDPSGTNIYSGGFLEVRIHGGGLEDKFKWGLENDFIVFEKIK